MVGQRVEPGAGPVVGASVLVSSVGLWSGQLPDQLPDQFAGTVAGTVAGSVAGTVAGTVAGPVAVPIAGTAVGAVAGTVAGTVACTRHRVRNVRREGNIADALTKRVAKAHNDMHMTMTGQDITPVIHRGT